jgi:hypothetical protein
MPMTNTYGMLLNLAILHLFHRYYISSLYILSFVLYDSSLHEFFFFVCTVWFLDRLNWKLKWGFQIARCPSVWLSVSFYIFDFSGTTRLILTRLAQFTLDEKGFKLFQMKEDALLQGGIMAKRVKIHWKFFFSFF